MCECNHTGEFNCVSVVPIFYHLSEEEMEKIQYIAKTLEIKKGEYVYRQGETAHALYVIYSGRIKQTRINISGKEQVLRILDQGDFMGEYSLFNNTNLSDNALATEDCILCSIDADDFRGLISKFPSISIKILEVMSKRLDSAEESIEMINNSSVPKRVASAILDMSKNNMEIDLPMTKGDLASIIGTSQESLSRNLSNLEKEGLIALKGQKKIIVENRDKLKEYIESLD